MCLFFSSFLYHIFSTQWVQVRDRRLAEASSLVTSLLVFFPGHVSYEAAKQWLKAADSNSSWADVNSPERITT